MRVLDCGRRPEWPGENPHGHGRHIQTPLRKAPGPQGTFLGWDDSSYHWHPWQLSSIVRGAKAADVNKVCAGTLCRSVFYVFFNNKKKKKCGVLSIYIKITHEAKDVEKVHHLHVFTFVVRDACFTFIWAETNKKNKQKKKKGFSEHILVRREH